MQYALFSIDNSRKHYTDDIIRRLSWSYVETTCVNGSKPEELSLYQDVYKYPIHHDRVPKKSGLTVGELGIWYTVLNALEHAPLITFEDDAILGPNFQEEFYSRINDLPPDFDFFSLFLPRDSDHMYDRGLHYCGSEKICHAYQNYGGVSMYFSYKGTNKINRLLRRDGIADQWDNTLYKYAKAGQLKGYTSIPTLSDLVYITGKEDSIVHSGEFNAIRR